VFKTERKFTIGLLNQSAPTLLVSGGTYATMKELLIESVLPFVFPYGIGGPKMNRRTKISLEACIQHYMRLSLPQFLKGDAILVLNHMYSRQLSYKSGVMVCRSTINGVLLGEKLSELTVNELQRATDGKNCSPSRTTEKLLKAISTSCRAMGHTTEAAQFARRSCFAMADFFGLNSLFLTTTPCDECTHRVRLYSKAQEWVSC
jgi:hypothetical protein